MKQNQLKSLFGSCVWLVLAALSVAACAAPVAVNPASASSEQQAPQSNAAQPAAKANPQPQAGSGLMDAPMNKTKFPNASLKPNEGVSFVGRTVKLEGAGYTPGAALDLVWGTLDGSFKLGEQMEFYTYKFTERTVPLAKVVADADGNFAHDFVVPEDYGGSHNIYVVSEGEKVMQAGVVVRTEYFVSPLSGPVGTPITVKITGIGYAKWEEARMVSYDNQFTGILNAVMTRGTATATIRAAGGAGKHIVRISSGAMEPYLNVQQSPNYFPGRVQDYTFTVTAAEPAAQNTELKAEWVNRAYPELLANPGMAGPKGERLSVTPNYGAVGTPMKFSASGFAPNTTVDLQWEAMRGNRNSGWSAQTFPMEKFTTDASGNFVRDMTIPDDLGGSHALLAMVDGKRVADARLIIEPGILSMTPGRGPAGTDIKIVLKGVGWTEVDNVYVMTYDNSITGYACGFNSGGDVTINFKATGAPGWHFIDFWPSIYIGHMEQPWVPNTPWLSLASHPGLPKPALHLAFFVTE